MASSDMDWIEVRRTLYTKYILNCSKSRFVINLKFIKVQYRGDGLFFYSYPIKNKKYMKMGFFSVWNPLPFLSKFLRGKKLKSLFKRIKTPSLAERKYSDEAVYLQKLYKPMIRKKLRKIVPFWYHVEPYPSRRFLGLLAILILVVSYLSLRPNDLQKELGDLSGVGGFGEIKLDDKELVQLNDSKREELEKDEEQKNALLGIVEVQNSAGKPGKKGLKKIVYKVQRGDTLSEVSQKFNVSVESIAGSSGIRTIDYISVGQTLKIPSKEGFYHTVKKSERLGIILNKYKLDLERVLSENPLLNPDLISEGDEIFLPGVKPKNLIRRWLVPVHSRIITSGYGWRSWPRRAFHKGLDLKAYYTSVRVARSGRVTYAGWLGGYGKAIVVQHASGYRTLYAHLSKIYVRRGSQVGQGKVIGRSGNTGYSFGPHLHFEVSHRGRNLNPRRILKGLRGKRRR